MPCAECGAARATWGCSKDKITHCKNCADYAMMSCRSGDKSSVPSGGTCCEFDDCNARASYGEEGGKIHWCKKHKKSTSVYLLRRRCQFEGCNVVAGHGECDERQHKSATRQVEQCRMSSLSQHFGQARVLFLRFNPDGYKSTGAQASLQQRHDTLVRLVREILGEQYATPRAHLAVLYLYYDGWKSLADEQWEILESTSLDYDELGQALSSLSLAQASSSGC